MIGYKKNANNDQISVDAIVVPTSVLANQLLNVVAENLAIEDCIYKLNKALSAKVIDQEFFLKNMREQTRDQFIKQALIKKITLLLNGTRG